ncbi:hypothetical protein A6A29_40740 [Streptomyces sp. TSRI0281]|nr:hypothetical protein A6A29_40740 [Streptomyces sp. TSRI0281]
MMVGLRSAEIGPLATGVLVVAPHAAGGPVEVRRKSDSERCVLRSEGVRAAMSSQGSPISMVESRRSVRSSYVPPHGRAW